MSLATFLATCRADAIKVATAIENAMPKIKSTVDTLAADALPIVDVLDPTAAAGMQAFIALFDEFVNAVEGAGTKNADGTISLTVSASTVTQGESVIADARSWLAKIGVKV